MVSERSLGSLLFALAAVALLGVSLALPWFTYEHSTGRRAPEGGFEPEEDGVIRTSWDAQPGSYSGDVEPSDPEAAQTTVERVAWVVYGSMGLLVLVALGELPGIDRVLTRRVNLGLLVAGFATVTAALVYAWTKMPDALASYGVEDAFTSFVADDGYTMTTLRIGWSLAALALPFVFGAFLFKFQAGAPDPTVVAELYAQGEI